MSGSGKSAGGRRTKWSSLDSIDPADWSYVGTFYCGPDEHPFGEWNDEQALNALEASTVSLFDGTGRCDHCGAYPFYVAVVRHDPSGDVIAIGETCLGTRFDFADRAERDLSELRRAVAAARQRAADKAAAEEARVAFLAEHPAEATILAAVLAAPAGRDQFLVDLAEQWERRGSLSDSQIPWVVKCVERETAQAEREAQRAATLAAAGPIAEGRYEIVGEVVAAKWVDNDFGGALKITVLTESGHRVWGTAPSAIASLPIFSDDEHTIVAGYRGVTAGDKVAFTAAVERSDRDETFGFYKRPTKARLIEAATDTEEQT